MHQGRVCLDGDTVRKYLIDQIGLYVYLFLDRQAGDFLTEPCLKVKLYVRPYLLGKGLTDINVICNDIVGRVREEFLLNLNKVDGSSFFLDVLLSTYLIGFVTQGRLIWKAINGQLSSPISPEDLPDPNQEDNDHRLRDILLACKRKLDATCQMIIDKRYNNYYLREVPASDIAEDMGTGVKSVEGMIRRCMEKLRNCVVAECQRQRLNFSPR
ncbi:hypothetical protein GO730_21360 [Spirosoma sp. HMF3257]|uniref:Uncharacterized protein n=1 Tax=Spirosoma telluris TaxID=2183553 RepID=A0A327NMR1_9BACT|nr:hypothetical protein [Spirosoma telluris]RAI76083.1 hypothetical protein HMF3257_21280 [Spirosoma telluris]